MPDMPDPPRKQRTLLVVLLVLGALVVCLAAAAAAFFLLFMPVRQEMTEIPQPEITTGAPGAETPSVEAGSIEAEAESVVFLIMSSSAGWAGHITAIETTTLLRRPVIVVSTDIGPEQAGLAEEMTSGLASFVGGLVTGEGAPYTYYIQVLSSEGDLIGTVGSTDERWKLEAPAAPADPEALRAWLAAVYGSASPEPEPWANRIIAITRDGADGYAVVRTDLDPRSTADQRAAQTIIDAVNSSGATFATGIRVVFADGVFEWSSLLVGTDPYGP